MSLNATGEIIAYTDSDATVDRMWLENLLEPFNDPLVAAVSGKALFKTDRRCTSWIKSVDNAYRYEKRGEETSLAVGLNCAFRKAVKVKEDKRERIPAVTHVDGTGRLQSVEKDQNSKYWKLIKEFEKLTGVPVVLNTSFNENEPIVNSPQEAIECFLRTKMDCLIVGNCFVQKTDEDQKVERVLRLMNP